MDYAEKAARFAKLHIKGEPFVLYNAWDAGSAKVILEAGPQAIATSKRPYVSAMSALRDDASRTLH
jgi:2-methylisocitrate lyase-like PEP mutase family enzyme